MRYLGKEVTPEQMLIKLHQEKSIKEIADETNLSKESLRRWFEGLNVPKVDSFDALLDACGYMLVIQKKPIGLEGAAVEAKKLGLSYGQYMARKGQK